MDDATCAQLTAALDSHPSGLTPDELGAAAGVPAGEAHDELWRTGRSLGYLYDGHRWRPGSAGSEQVPLASPHAV